MENQAEVKFTCYLIQAVTSFIWIPAFGQAVFLHYPMSPQGQSQSSSPANMFKKKKKKVLAK